MENQAKHEEKSKICAAGPPSTEGTAAADGAAAANPPDPSVSKIYCPPIAYNIGSWVDKSFAATVLRPATYEKVYIQGKTISAMIDPSRYDLEYEIGHPHFTELRALVILINATGFFNFLVSNGSDPFLIQEIASTYGFYHPACIVTYYEDLLWHADRTKRLELMTKCGIPSIATIEKALNGEVLMDADTVKVLLEIVGIENYIPDNPRIQAVLKLRDTNSPRDWTQMQY